MEPTRPFRASLSRPPCGPKSWAPAQARQRTATSARRQRASSRWRHNMLLAIEPRQAGSPPLPATPGMPLTWSSHLGLTTLSRDRPAGSLPSSRRNSGGLWLSLWGPAPQKRTWRTSLSRQKLLAPTLHRGGSTHLSTSRPTKGLHQANRLSPPSQPEPRPPPPVAAPPQLPWAASTAPRSRSHPRLFLAPQTLAMRAPLKWPSRCGASLTALWSLSTRKQRRSGPSTWNASRRSTASPASLRASKAAGRARFYQKEQWSVQGPCTWRPLCRRWKRRC
mmetsp:Transcript_9095/g.26093  ORF Transcript_9095/g.26093 Transcript_9095/m.26093 type:complete len:278 (+) Transcript_9095:801-1634(+)